MAVSQQQFELLAHDQRVEIGLEQVGQAAHFGENPLQPDDTAILTVRQLRQPFRAPATRVKPDPQHGVCHSGLARVAWQRLTEFF